MKTMKKTAFSVCAAALLLFSACSKDDDEKNVSEMSVTEMNSMIIGTWNYTNSEWWDSDGRQGTKKAEGAEKLTFNSDGTYTELEDDFRETGTYWITNKKELIKKADSYYSKDTLTIESLTKTELILIEEERYKDEWEKTRAYYKKIN